MRRVACIAFIALLGHANANSASDVDIVAFADVKSGNVVAEFLPDDDYFLNLFCEAVGEAGHVYAVSVKQSSATMQPAPCANVTAITLKLQRHPAPESWSASDDPGVVYEYWSFTQPAENFSVPEPLDVIFTHHYHELYEKSLGPSNTQLVGVAWLQALKPDGVLIVESSAGSNPEQIKQEMLAVGFSWAGERRALREADRVMLKFRKR